jgi:hypothetical protein
MLLLIMSCQSPCHSFRLLEIRRVAVGRARSRGMSSNDLLGPPSLDLTSGMGQSRRFGEVRRRSALPLILTVTADISDRQLEAKSRHGMQGVSEACIDPSSKARVRSLFRERPFLDASHNSNPDVNQRPCRLAS